MARRPWARVESETGISLYMPTSRLGTDARGVNRLVFKDLAGKALAQPKEAGVDKKEIAVFDQRFDHEDFARLADEG